MPHPNPKGRHTPTAGRPHMHPHTTLLSSTNHSGGENYQGSRGSTAQRSLRKPLPLAFSWIWSCEDQKNSEATRQDGKTTCRKSLHLAGTPQLGKAAKRPEEQRQWRNPPRRGRTQARSPTPSDDPQKREENHDNKENRQRPQGTEGQPRATRRPPQAATRHATKTKANATDTRPGDIPPREDKESRTKKNAVANTSTKRYNNTTSPESNSERPRPYRSEATLGITAQLWCA